MSEARLYLATAKRELAERQDEANLCMVELKHAQEMMASGGTGDKVLSVRDRDRHTQRERGGARKMSREGRITSRENTRDREGGRMLQDNSRVAASWWMFLFSSLCEVLMVSTAAVLYPVAPVVQWAPSKPY